MKQIEVAGNLIGVNLSGGGKGHEPQGASDQQLRTAQGLLHQTRAGLPVKAQRHVDRALAQLSIALSIK
jgi:hypothetical protein